MMVATRTSKFFVPAYGSMDIAALVVMLLSVIALASVVIYFIWDYLRYKDSNDSRVKKVDENVTKEKSDRLSNVKYVVDQVNDVNQDIYNNFSSSNVMLNRRINKVAHDHARTVRGIGKVMSFSTNNHPLRLGDLPGYKNPDVKLLQNVTAVMGLTVKDLDKTGNTMKICSKIDSSRCIQIPDKQGNTLIQNLDSAGDVIIRNRDYGHGIKLDGDVSVNNNLSFTPIPGNPSTINNVNGNMLVRTNRLGVGNSLSQPSAVMQVKASNPTDTIFSVDTAKGPRLLVAGNGDIIVKDNQGQRNVATIRPNHNGIDILAPNVNITGNLNVAGAINANHETVRGNLNVNGSETVRGNLNVMGTINTPNENVQQNLNIGM